jgi:hypothetical protein
MGRSKHGQYRMLLILQIHSGLTKIKTFVLQLGIVLMEANQYGTLGYILMRVFSYQ